MKKTICTLLLGAGLACAGRGAETQAPGAAGAEESAADSGAPSASEREVIREYMWALARQVRALDEELDLDGTTDGDRMAIESKLERVESIAADLERANAGFRHPLLDVGLPRFKEQVDAALVAVREESPTYVSAGKVIGACATCHDTRACPFDSYSRCIDERTPPGAP